MTVGKKLKSATKATARKVGKAVKSVKKAVTGNSRKKSSRARKSTARKTPARKKR